MTVNLNKFAVIPSQIVGEVTGTFAAEGFEDFRVESQKLMSETAPGLRLVDEGLYGAVAAEGTPDVADEIRQGTLLAFRLLHEAHILGTPFAEVVNGNLAKLAKEIDYRLIRNDSFQRLFRTMVATDYQRSPAVGELLDGMTGPARFGGRFVLACFGSSVNPNHRQFPLPLRPVQDTKQSRQSARHMNSLIGRPRFG